MIARRVDPGLVSAWLSARSVARSIAAPIADRGGWRVDTGTAAEWARWVFAAPGPGIAEVAGLIGDSRCPIKLVGTADELRALLPARWRLRKADWFMTSSGAGIGKAPLPRGYRSDVERFGMAIHARIVAPDGLPAAIGHAAESDGAFVYDCIVTDPGHRRRGLGRALMTSLRSARRAAEARELLVATDEGRALYERLGWTVQSPYITATRDEAQ